MEQHKYTVLYGRGVGKDGIVGKWGQTSEQLELTRMPSKGISTSTEPATSVQSDLPLTFFIVIDKLFFSISQEIFMYT